jgi:hypothetical protein
MTDTSLMLVHNVQAALQAKWHCSALLFNTKGFFDNMHKDHLAAIMTNLGFPPGTPRPSYANLGQLKAAP